jgi:hypothetical protein
MSSTTEADLVYKILLLGDSEVVNRYMVNDLVVPVFNLPAFIRFYYETIISLIRIEK